MDADALVVGAGPNGLVAANVLADAGWSVIVLEAASNPGGGATSGRYVDPAFISDLCSAFYPLAVVSPAIRALDLEKHGLAWRHAPYVLAHPLLDGRALAISRDVSTTTQILDTLASGDGAAWQELVTLWERISDALLDSLATPFPPVRAGVRLLRALYPLGIGRFARMATLPVRRLSEEYFRGPTGLLLAGNALHADFAPESALSGFYGWFLAMLAQSVGFPVAEGGAQSLTDALVRRLMARGGKIRCGQSVRHIVVRTGRAVAVRLEDGEELGARRAVLAAVPAPTLYGELVDREALPATLRRDMTRFHWDFGTVKVDWALDRPVPWRSEIARQAGTVHVSASMDELTDYSAQLAKGLVPDRPFVIVGQLSTADPSRSPAGTESLWGYTHIPQQVRGDAGPDGLEGRWDSHEIDLFADRIEAQIERFAPGFRDCIRARVVHGPRELDAAHLGLRNGAFGLGTAALHQQAVFRPTPGTGRPETPVQNLYLASSSAHPGAGVHGLCGWNAAQAALHADDLTTRLIGTPLRLLAERLARGRDDRPPKPTETPQPN